MIYIPTYGRVDRQVTFENLPTQYQEMCTFVVYHEEAHHHVERGRKVLALPPGHDRGIGNKREYIRKRATENIIVMLDDDLVFAARREDDPTKFRTMEPADYERMFHSIEVAGGDYMHGAIAMREGGNRNTADSMVNTRALRAHFIRRDAPAQYWDNYMEDFHFTLQLLTQGWPNIVLNAWVSNQSGSNKEGGCNEEGRMVKHAAAAHELHAAFPDYVTVVEKETKGAWGGGKRTDVRIQWKRAYAAGMNRR